MTKRQSKTTFTSSIEAEDLSRKELVQRYEIIQELKRRKRSRKEAYIPNEGQLPVHKSELQTRAVFSGNGAGKTAMGVNEAYWAATGYNIITRKFLKIPARVIIILDDPEKVKDVWIPEMEKWHNLDNCEFKKNGKPYINEIAFPSGSTIKFMFHQQDPLKFESIELDMAIFDEPPPRHVYISLRRGGRKANRSPRYLFLGTPITGSWMRREIYEPWSKKERPDIECFKFGTIVNQQNLSEGYIESFSRVLSEKEKRIRLHGEFFDLQGLALAHLFDMNVHIIKKADFEWDNSNPCVVIIDPHPNKAHVAIILGADRDNNYYYLDELIENTVPREFARNLKNFYKGYRLIDIISDSLGAQAMMGGEGNKSFIQVLQDEGIRVRTTSWEEKQDDLWLMRIQEALTVPKTPNNFGQFIPKLRILEGNRGIITDIENVCWLKFKNMDEYKPKLDISNRDFLACVKYGLASNLAFNKSKSKMYTINKKPTSYGAKKCYNEPIKIGEMKLNVKRSKRRSKGYSRRKTEDF